jgi:phage/plasmid-associated DNA primase
MNLPIDVKAIIEEFGPPAYENEKGKISKLNENFWAAYYARQREKIIFEPDERAFYDFDPNAGIFVPKSSDSIRKELSALILDGAQTWSGFRALEQFRSERNLAGAITFLRGHVEERDFFNPPFHSVHLGNCTLRFEPDGSKFTAEGFSPNHRSRNRSPINYDPNAKCPEFEKTILGHVCKDDQLLLQKYAGQCLLGRNLTQRFGILDGVGASSKGSFVLVISGVIGPKNVYELRTKMLAERFEIGRMIGRTLLVGSDVKGNFLSQSGAYRIKSIVGGDALEAELKASNKRFTVHGIFNLLITSNSRLRILLEGDRSAWERRVFIVRYDTPYTGKRIFEIEKYLLKIEAPGVLNWCVTGLKLLFQDYAKEGDIILTPDQKARVDALLSESDSLRLFVSNNIIKAPDPMSNGTNYSLTIQEIVAEYIDDCINDKHWTPVSAEHAEKRVPNLMLELFGVTKSHSIPRNGKAKRGFWYVRFL